ncbi:MAG: hypothetical protein IJH98_07725, partial [Solobacterium sp.]|nr:hypothetical protein [Solobacterium sp.]
MYYPAFPQKGDTLGICAPSAGVGRKLESFDQSLAVLRRTWAVKETKSVRVNDLRSTDAAGRADEL